jgi:opacity protein-like surface antigen
MRRLPKGHAMRVLVPALFVLTLLATAAAAADSDPKTAPAPKRPPAVFTPSPSGWYVEGRAGFAPWDLDDPNASIAYIEQIAADNLGAPGPLRRFDYAAVFALEVGHRRGNWSYGLAAENQWERVSNFTSGTVNGSLEQVSLMSTIDVRLTTTVRPAKLFGFEAGASAGMSYAHYSEMFALAIFPAPENNLTLSGAYHASAPVAGAHLGWRRPLYGNTWLVARGAWYWRDFGEFKGRAEDRSGGEIIIVDQDLLVLGTSEKASIDASGFQYSAGLSYTFGGRR